MGNGRFLYNNLITSETMLAVSSLRNGIVTAALKEGLGSAELNPSGNYTGTLDKEYIVEIDSVASGVSVGQATFKWSDGSSGWNATGVTTSASNLDLNSGAMINFSSGAGDDFAVGDKWYFKGVNLFNAGKMLDMNRDNRYRAAGLEAPNTITVTFASALEVKALVIYDHNLTSAATITINGNPFDLWDLPAFFEGVTWAEEKIVHYLSSAQTYQYWQLQVTDAANPDGFVEIGEIYLGSYFEPSKNYKTGYSENIATLKNMNATQYGIERDRFFNYQRTFQFNFPAMPSADVTDMKTMLTALGTRSTGIFKPLWFNPDSASPSDSWMVKIEALPVNHLVREYYDMPLTLREVVKSV